MVWYRPPPGTSGTMPISEKMLAGAFWRRARISAASATASAATKFAPTADCSRASAARYTP